MPDHSPNTDERASRAQPSQYSSPLECTFHLGLSLAILTALLDPDQAYNLNCSYPRIYVLRRVPNMTEQKRWEMIPRRARDAYRSALAATIEATGSYCGLLDKTPELLDSLNRLLPDELPPTRMPISFYTDPDAPLTTAPPETARIAMDDVTALRKLAMRIRRATAKNCSP